MGKQVVVQTGTGSQSKDISDIVAIGSDDASDYISSGMISGVIDHADEGEGQDEMMSPKEVRNEMEKMTPRRRVDQYHKNDVTDMPAHDDSTLEKTLSTTPFGFGISSLFNTHGGDARDDKDILDKEDEPKIEKKWYQEERYPVTMSSADVVKQSWDTYYRENKIPEKEAEKKDNGEGKEGDTGNGEGKKSEK